MHNNYAITILLQISRSYDKTLRENVNQHDGEAKQKTEENKIAPASVKSMGRDAAEMALT